MQLGGHDVSPQLQRPGHPYVQIADHYRRLIADGQLQPGSRMPTVTSIAEDWGVSPGTAHKAIRLLAGERLVEPTQQGTWVLGPRAAPTPRDRMFQVRRTDSLGPDQRVEITEAHVITAPDYVADIMGQQHGADVVRRESITYSGDLPVMLTVVWMPEVFTTISELTSREPIDEIRIVRDKTDRAVTHGRDWVTGRPADRRESRALNIQAGDAITAGTWLWSDDDGVIQYGEYVMPANRVVTYSYDVDPGKTETSGQINT